MFSRNITSDSNTISDFDYKITLAGNPNVGKSTIFNQLTGLKQHTGNWTGKTVECSSGSYIYNDKKFKVTDLPGTYSINAFSEEERLAKEFLMKEETDCIVIVADSNILERNLVLALQILSFKSKAVLCLNLSDEADKNGIHIDVDELSLNLGIPVVCTSAVKRNSLKQLKETVFDVCSGKIKCFRVNRNFENINIFDEDNRENNTFALANLSKEICSKVISKIKSRR